MKRVSEAKRRMGAVAAVVGASIAATQDIILGWIPGASDIPESARAPVFGITTFFVIIIAVYLVWVGLLGLIDRYRWFRSIFAREDQIEGGWVDIVFDPKTRDVIAGGLLFVAFKHDELTVDGESFNSDSTSGGSFKSTMTRYEDSRRVLQFLYEIELNAADFKERTGFARYDFKGGDTKPPSNFWGYFYVNGFERRMDVYGEKLSEPDAKRLQSSGLREKGEFVAKFIEENSDRIRSQNWRYGGDPQESGDTTATRSDG